MFGGPTDFHKLRLAELNERFRTLEDTAGRLRAEKVTAEQGSANLQAHLLQAQETLRRHEQRVTDLQVQLRQAQATLRSQELRAANLQDQLREAHNTIQQQEQKLASASGGRRHPAYRDVGLDESCLDFLLPSVRRAYALALHSDRCAPGERNTAQQKLKDEELKKANAALDTICKLRNLR
jgi:DNA repair exonuclease SbcCD ATPase subunit